jgi:hypothetical protein
MADAATRVLARSLSTPDGCLIWQGGLNSLGYGQITVDVKKHQVHRLVYEAKVGPIPEGLVLDHLCRHRACVNTDHLEPVTERVNILRGTGPTARNAQLTHCKYGHPLTGDNVRQRGTWRVCRQCDRERARVNYWRARSMAPPEASER